MVKCALVGTVIALIMTKADIRCGPTSKAIAPSITVNASLQEIRWIEVKADLAADQFDNGRSPDALRRSFERSEHLAIARDRSRVVGTARQLRRQGIGPRMVRQLMDEVPGQHIADEHGITSTGSPNRSL